MRITHTDPEFTGTEVVDTIAYEFTDGVATVDELREDRAVALHQIGWGIGDEPPVGADAAAAAMQELAKGGFSKPRELGDDVPDDEVEPPQQDISRP